MRSMGGILSFMFFDFFFFCLSVRLHISKTTRLNFTIFTRVAYMAVALRSPLVTLQYVMYYIIILPVFRMTSFFHIMYTYT